MENITLKMNGLYTLTLNVFFLVQVQCQVTKYSNRANEIIYILCI